MDMYQSYILCNDKIAKIKTNCQINKLCICYDIYNQEIKMPTSYICIFKKMFMQGNYSATVTATDQTNSELFCLKGGCTFLN